jgi:hypothetical protein
MEPRKIEKLLVLSLKELDRRWKRDPYNLELSLALTIKQFMKDFEIKTPSQGVKDFFVFKRHQNSQLGMKQTNFIKQYIQVMRPGVIFAKA